MSLLDWYIEKISKSEYVKNVELMDKTNNLIKVTHNDNNTYIVHILDSDIIDSKNFSHQIDLHNLDFILAHKKDIYVTNNTILTTRIYKYAIGNMGDLLRALRDKNVNNYLAPDIEFVLNGLNQHGKIKSIEHLDNKRLLLKRTFPLNEIIVLIINDYDITAETIRFNKQVFKNFKIILCSNPNARISSSAKLVAKQLNILILKYGEFLGRINSRV